MTKLLAALILAAVVGVAAPGNAAAEFALSIGAPGFGLWVGLPTPPVYVAPAPVYYTPHYYAYAPPAHVLHAHRPGCGHGYGWGRYARGHGYRFPGRY